MIVFNDMTAEKLFVYPYRVNLSEGNIPVIEGTDRYTVSMEEVDNKNLILICLHITERRNTKG